jgi:hypothetical protein
MVGAWQLHQECEVSGDADRACGHKGARPWHWLVASGGRRPDQGPDDQHRYRNPSSRGAQSATG